jgi:hypothetical protein
MAESLRLADEFADAAAAERATRAEPLTRFRSRRLN